MVSTRQDGDELSNDTVSIYCPQEISPESAKKMILITSLACQGDGEMFFCRREDGSVYLYDTKYEQQCHKLFGHANKVSIVSLFYDNESNTLISLDVTSRIIANQLVYGQDG